MAFRGILQDPAFWGNPSGLGHLGKILQDFAFWDSPSGFCLLGGILQDSAFWGNPSGFCLFGEVLKDAVKDFAFGNILNGFAFWAIP